MSEELSIEERLKKLPRRFVVAFAARAARRVQPLAMFAFEQHGEIIKKRQLRAIDRAILIVESFAIGQYAADVIDAAAATVLPHAEICFGVYSRAARSARAAVHAAALAAAHAADTYVDATLPAIEAAHSAFHAADAYFNAKLPAIEAAVAEVAGYDAARLVSSRDLDHLEVIATTGGYGPDSKAGLDSTEDGPLGPYWKSPPSWWTPPDRSAKLIQPLINERIESPTLAASLDTAGDNLGLVVELDLPDGFSKAEMVELVAAISEGLDEVYQGFGGRGLSIKDVEIEEFDDAPVPANVD